MQKITDIPPKSLEGHRVIVRADLNVPIEHGKVGDDFRIKRVIQTIDYLRKHRAKVIIISHIGRKPEETLAPVYEHLKHLISGLVFVPEAIGHLTESAVQMMQNGDVVLLENLRRYPGEEANDPQFVAALARLGEIYVGDAFSAAHREHASIVGLPKALVHYAGLLMADEVEHLSVALKPPTPAVCILGGAKFDTKEPLMRRLLDNYEHLFIGGALVNDVFKARGMNVGRSLVSDKSPSADVLNDPRLVVPVDVIAQRSDGQAVRKLPHELSDDDKVVDVGPDSVAAFAPCIEKAQFVLWNGPLGLYEEGFNAADELLINAITSSSAKAVVGGGDTVASVNALNIGHKFWFLSTGGGAMLEFLLKGSLPGVDALK